LNLFLIMAAAACAATAIICLDGAVKCCGAIYPVTSRTPLAIAFVVLLGTFGVGLGIMAIRCLSVIS